MVRAISLVEISQDREPRMIHVVLDERWRYWYELTFSLI